MKPGNWRKSSRSGGNGGDCVEARLNVAGPQVRDSKMGEASPILSLSRSDFTALLDSVKLSTECRGGPPWQWWAAASCSTRS